MVAGNSDPGVDAVNERLGSFVADLLKDGTLCEEDIEVEQLAMRKCKTAEDRRRGLGRFLRKVLRKIEVDWERRGLPMSEDFTEHFGAAADYFEHGPMPKDKPQSDREA